MRRYSVGALRWAIGIDQWHAGEVPKPTTAEIGSKGFPDANQPAKSAQRASDGLVGHPIEDRAQQRRHDLQHCHSLAPYNLRQLRWVPDLRVGTDVDAPSDHQGREELPHRDVESLRRRLRDHVRGRQLEVRNLGKEVIEQAPLLDHGAFRDTR